MLAHNIIIVCDCVQQYSAAVEGVYHRTQEYNALKEASKDACNCQMCLFVNIQLLKVIYIAFGVQCLVKGS
jgi:hypothetical protein